MELKYSIDKHCNVIKVHAGNFTGTLMKDDVDRLYVMWMNGYWPDITDDNDNVINIDELVNIDSKKFGFKV
jgi:hypothetical protein